MVTLILKEESEIVWIRWNSEWNDWFWCFGVSSRFSWDCDICFRDKWMALVEFYCILGIHEDRNSHRRNCYMSHIWIVQELIFKHQRSEVGEWQDSVSTHGLEKQLTAIDCIWEDNSGNSNLTVLNVLVLVQSWKRWEQWGTVPHVQLVHSMFIADHSMAQRQSQCVIHWVFGDHSFCSKWPKESSVCIRGTSDRCCSKTGQKLAHTREFRSDQWEQWQQFVVSLLLLCDCPWP